MNDPRRLPSVDRLLNLPEMLPLIDLHGRPSAIRCDNGPELTSKAMFFWSQRTGVKLQFIQPGKPTQNAFVESFNRRFGMGV